MDISIVKEYVLKRIYTMALNSIPVSISKIIFFGSAKKKKLKT